MSSCVVKGSWLLYCLQHPRGKLCVVSVFSKTREILETEAKLEEGPIKGLGAGVYDRQGEAEQG